VRHFAHHDFQTARRWPDRGDCGGVSIRRRARFCFELNRDRTPSQPVSTSLENALMGVFYDVRLQPQKRRPALCMSCRRNHHYIRQHDLLSKPLLRTTTHSTPVARRLIIIDGLNRIMISSSLSEQMPANAFRVCPRKPFPPIGSWPEGMLFPDHASKWYIDGPAGKPRFASPIWPVPGQKKACSTSEQPATGNLRVVREYGASSPCDNHASRKPKARGRTLVSPKTAGADCRPQRSWAAARRYRAAAFRSGAKANVAAFGLSGGEAAISAARTVQNSAGATALARARDIASVAPVPQPEANNAETPVVPKPPSPAIRGQTASAPTSNTDNLVCVFSWRVGDQNSVSEPPTGKEVAI